MSSMVVRYSPKKRAHIPSFPNQIPKVDQQTGLPNFKDQKNDDAALHLVRFHMHIHKLGVKLYEDSLMKMFMATLEGDVRSWYDGLPSVSLPSLKYFHTVFHEHFNSLLSIQDWCTHNKEFIENVKDTCGDEQYMDEEVLEIIHEFSAQK